MILSIALGAAQGVVLLDAMAKDQAKNIRLSGTLVVTRPGKQPEKAVFFLTKPNRFQVKGAGIDVWFDGKVRHELKNGQWVAVGKDSSLPVALRGLEGFFGKKVVAQGPTVRTKGIPGVGYTVAENVVFYVNEKTHLPVGRSRTDANGNVTWVHYKDVQAKRAVVAAKASQPKVSFEDPRAITGMTVPLPMGQPVTTLAVLKAEDLERPNPPVAVATPLPAESTANTKAGQAAVHETPEQLEARLPKAGEMAKLFTSQLATGGVVDLGKIVEKSKGVVLVFWHSNCPVSAEYIPQLEALRPELSKSKVFLVSVNSWDDVSTIKKFLAEKKSTMLTATGSEAAELYNVAGHPATIVLDDEGKVIASFIGANEAALRAALERIKS